MNEFEFRSPASSWSLETLELPFGTRPSIYAHLRASALRDVGVAVGRERLPDEEGRPRGGVRLGPGGLDGVMSHHVKARDTQQATSTLLEAIWATLEDAAAFDALYARMQTTSALSVVDPLLASIRAQREAIPVDRLAALCTFVGRAAPDREPVKLAIAILGLFRPTEAIRELLLTLGRHEEFALFVSVAIANTWDDAEIRLWELAKLLEGWGRIQVVKRLSEAKNPRVRRWLVREGYRNQVLNEYLTYTCATAGRLLDELRADHVDAELLVGAGDLLDALVAGGPARGMGDYEDGAEATELYVRHVAEADPDLGQLLALKSLARFLNHERWKEARRPERGWTPERTGWLREALQRLFERECWVQLIEAGLASEDPVVFSRANVSAKALGVDTWEAHFSRLVAGLDDGAYHELMQTHDPQRLERVLEVAEGHVDLEAIGTGPKALAGIGSEFAPHRAVGAIVEGLERLPGRGWPILQAALRCPVTRVRSTAVRTLSRWGQEQWPVEARESVERALRLEPVDRLRENLGRLLAGQPLNTTRRRRSQA